MAYNLSVQTVIETPAFAANNPLTEEQTSDLISLLAIRPAAGDLIQGAGGLRKLRWAASGRGKRGGARVIYYFHNEEIPLFLISAYLKSDKADLSKKQKNEAKMLIRELVESYRTTL